MLRPIVYTTSRTFCKYCQGVAPSTMSAFAKTHSLSIFRRFETSLAAEPTVEFGVTTLPSSTLRPAIIGVLRGFVKRLMHCSL